MIAQIIKRDLRISFANLFLILNPVLFFVITVAMLPFSTSSNMSVLRNIGPGVILHSLLFAFLINLNFMLEDDYEDGSLEQLLLAGIEAYKIIIAKVISYWLIVALPMLVSVPFVSLIYDLSLRTTSQMLVIFAVTSLGFSSIGCLGTALTLGIKKSTMLNVLITLPLTVTLMIFAASAIEHPEQILTIIALLLILFPANCFFSAVLIQGK